MSQCKVCRVGKNCPRGSEFLQDCPRGYYCLRGDDPKETGVPVPCPRGTFGSRVGLKSRSECTDCTPGSYCEKTGLSNVTDRCKAGYWCERKASTSTPSATDPGNFGPCPSGGYYCEAGSSAPQRCPAGRYARPGRNKLKSAEECDQCPVGYYCAYGNQTQATGMCSPGYYCLAGSPVREPTNGTFGGKCFTGHFCPEASPWPKPCPAGEYNKETARDTCLDCPAGFFCTLNTSSPIECPAGYYCPLKTETRKANPCPAGTFNNLTSRSSLDDCQPCTPGSYCATQGLSSVTGLCDGGYFCSNRSISKTPGNLDEGGGPCQPGAFCHLGSPAPIPCPAGRICTSATLTVPDGDCFPGHYCTGGANVAKPTGGVVGGRCPLGAYCPGGSKNYTQCPPGTYVDTEGNVNRSQCYNCTAGKYCKGWGNPSPTDDCHVGYYCPPGQILPNPYEYMCPEGHFCERGWEGPTRCVSGEYQDEKKKGSCKVCPAGYYCDNRLSPVVLYKNSSCPVGHYCPAGTKTAYENKCPRGTFSNETGLENVTQCSPCPGGYYCPELGQSSFTLLCNAGYYCRSGATIGTPEEHPENTTICQPGSFNFSDAGPCPEGRFCPQGTAEPQKCPRGTFSNSTKLQSQGECTNCTEGMFCKNHGLTQPSGTCWAGYYCPSGSDRPNYLECSPGSFCINGSAAIEPCPNGTYRNVTRGKNRDDCFACTPGSYCDGIGLEKPSGACGPGYYCPSGSRYVKPPGFQCWVGHYCPGGNPEPIPCRNNSYVNYTGAVQCEPCPAGFYCVIAGTTVICPEGYYCPAGTGKHLKSCPRGTYGPEKGYYEVGQCKPCSAGMYCGLEHMVNVTTKCAAGHWCAYGVDRPRPFGRNITSADVIYNASCPHYDGEETGFGGVCPHGTHCPKGTSWPIPCPSGSYAPQTGLATCRGCMEGYYCPENQSSYDSFPCPQGYYCPNRTKSPYDNPCKPGTYNRRLRRTKEEDCVLCSPGYFCPEWGMVEPNKTCEAGYYCRRHAKSGTPDQGTDANICPEGHYCINGTGEPYNCPQGTLNNQTGLKKEDECQTCPAGYYCSEAGANVTSGLCAPGYHCPPGSVTKQQESCPEGKYCPRGSATPELCPIGTYQPNKRQDNVDDCLTCTEGFFCATPGLANYSGPCANGSYCPTNSSTSTRYDCPKGFHCPEGSPQPKPCPAGKYTNATSASDCEICPPGYFCLPLTWSGVVKNDSKGYDICSTGFYCPEGTGSDLRPCKAGTFSNRTGLYSQAQCTDCTPGYFCGGSNLTAPTAPCAAGYYCTSGVAVSQPYIGSYNSTNYTCPLLEYLGQYVGIGDICPEGHYCPGQTPSPLGCLPGTYNDQKGQRKCKWCPAGYYCPSKTVSFVNNSCPSGHYCPNGTRYARQHPCSEGTYNDLIGQRSDSSCKACTRGMYCEGNGLSWPTGPCHAGWYCSGNATRNMTITRGGECQAGYYCPSGSYKMEPCPGGSFCATPGLPSPTGNCTAGYYCTLGANVSTPNDGVTGGWCSPGYYCPTGSTVKVPCEPGYYLDYPGATDKTSCKLCTLGKFCNGTGLEAPTGNCSSGYYCPAGQASGKPSNYSCPAGYYCLEGDNSPRPCPSGTYQDLTRKSSCNECPKRFYCNATHGPVVNYNPYNCPLGYYCPPGTKLAEEHPCAIGTFNNLTGRSTQAECTQCLGKYYCGQPGLTYPNTLCAAGYYCKQGAKTSTPAQGEDANICPEGSYCEEGTDSPKPCPAGTFSNIPGLKNSSSCTPCTAGYYCEYPGWTNETALCQQGYYCPKFSTSSTQMRCPQGRYCPTGSPVPKLCPRGTFSNNTGLWMKSQCTNCTTGYFCDSEGKSSPTGKCKTGYYCPVGSKTMEEMDCPIGFHCPEGSKTPRDCLSGLFTNTTRASICQQCAERYYCIPNNVTAGDPQSGYHVCPRGYYCPAGTGLDWKSCPKGTYSNSTGLSKESECEPCDGGYYCDKLNSTQPTALCYGGYYCESGVDRPDPIHVGNSTSFSHNCSIYGYHTGFGGICPVGYYCPRGSVAPVGCPDGSYQDRLGKTYCKSCPAGYYCQNNASSYINNECPVGHYCLMNTTQPKQYPCPAGTFNPKTAQTNRSACLSCTPGFYCEGTGNENPTNECSAGWNCSGGAEEFQPPGGRCLPGYYCPNGSSSPTPCDPGFYCKTAELSKPTHECEAGWYCTSTAIHPQPRDNITGNICPMGSYCPRGSKSPESCPIGTFLNTTGNRNITDCQDCIDGWYCGGSGLPSPTDHCDPGYYCDGRATRKDWKPCHKGHKCSGRDQPQPCPAGFYQDKIGKSDCKPCKAGYFCSDVPVTNYTSFECPTGYYCPEQTEFDTQFPCPRGKFNNLTKRREAGDCIPCTGGFACDETGLTLPYRPCSAGYYCRRSSNSTTPNLENDANICPPGYYCPEGTDAPRECPLGTFRSADGGQTRSDCQNCTGGDFCNETAMTATAGRCDPGFYCDEGSSSSRQFACPEGRYCERGTFHPELCPAGTFSNSTMGKSSGDCVQCTPGGYCETKGLTKPTGYCEAGYYCPLGSINKTTTECPIGTHCPTGSPLYRYCSDGMYTDYTRASICHVCPERFYCVPQNVVPGDISTVKTICPPGYFCPNGTGSDLRACPPGTYSDASGLSEERDCTPCDAGKFCRGSNLTEPNGPCQEGFYCLRGAAVPNPIMTNLTYCPAHFVHVTVGDICPRGHFCPEGSDMYKGCEPGTYNDEEGQQKCKDCPRGYYCLGNTTNYVSFVCPKGHYCPLKTPHPNYRQCPPGTYNDLMGGQNISACQQCTPGYYCSGWGNINPTDPCSPGWYCPGRNNVSKPSESECQPGFYCPINSSRMTPCDEGRYCPTPAMFEPGDLCDPGYYCPPTSTSARQEDCPPGNFCPIGSKLPSPCDPGTYLPGSNHVNKSECLKCTAGMYCNRSGLAEPSGMCAEMYYCPLGQISSRPTQYFCPPGHYCKVGFPEPRRCGNGTYQPNNYSTSCLPCEEGYYCDNTNVPVYDLAGLECPEGHYCPRGTKFATEFPCLAGTWSNVTQLVRGQQCFQCPQRYYCQRSGLRSPQDFCFPGYYCNQTGTRIPNPPDGECPRGYYCPRGSYLPVPCPRGSYTNSTRSGNMTDCKPCSPGKYCDPNAGVVQERDCDAGFVCLFGSTVPNPVNGSQGYQCPAGHFCPAGIVKEEPCPPTKYSPQLGLPACLPCPVGTICPNFTTVVPQPCPTGHYCPGGNDRGEPCPTGTYRRELSARYSSECLPCDAGFYCDRPGLDKPSGPCSEGYLCLNRSTSKTPNDATNRRCPEGEYCVNGTTRGELCPEGTMRNSVGGAKLEDCTPCRPGKFCDKAGLSKPSGECKPGYYCPEDTPIKVSAPEHYLCPSGHYCPEGTSDPKGCDPGLYQPNKGNNTCFICPPGKFCLGNTSIPEICPPRRYCPGSTIEPIFCPNGTYTNTNTTGLHEATQCSPCVPGHFCQRGEITGKCSAGYLCYEGNPTPTPDGSDKLIGEICPYGFYCPSGAINKVACSRGLVIDKSGARSADDCALCPAGKICSENNTLAVACTVGFYCPYNATMKPCPVGTYSDTVGATNSSSCQPCPAGYWCNRQAMSDFKISPCPVGFFCNEAIVKPTSCPKNGTYRNSTGAGSIEECFACPRGYICPINATVSPIACLNGTYCPPGSVEPRICQPGFYCPRSMYEVACPAGFYCPSASSYPLQCPMGYFCDPLLSNGTGGVIKPSLCPKGYEEIIGSHRQTLNDTCQICKPGHFNDDPSSHPCRKCAAGVICFEGATTDQPLANNSVYGVQYTKSFPCPVGYYCESGDTIPRPCPNKTYNPSERGSRRENCLPCEIDHYNHLTGQAACFHCGGQASQPYLGQDRCQCNGLHRVFMPSDQTCMCEKGFRAMDGRELDCVRKLYPFCPERTWRSQAGDCLDSEEWRVHCTSVCDGKYVEFDRQLGLCVCQVDDLEDICDKKCRRQQENRLEHVCASKPYLQINQIQGSPIVFDDLEPFSNIPNFFKTFSKDQCTQLDSGAHPFNLVEMGDNGFLGTYNPPANFIQNILNNNRKDENTTSDSDTPSSRRRRSLLAVSTSSNPLSGIANPTSCVNYGSSMMFIVDNDNYPEYDENNLYNTNPDFDSGPFRDLKERHALMNTNSTLFAFKFDSPGVYVFRSSKYPDYKMYVRVMAPGAQCAEDGPFFATTPRSVIQNGMAISQDILIMPDWLLIGLMMASLLLLMIILVIGLLIFRKHGWRKMVFASPKYRKLNTRYNFDDYSSKGSAVHPSKKLHRNFYAIDGAPATEATPAENSQADIGHEMRSDEFWDYEKQVDLEAFSCNEFYSILSKQSRDVTSSIARQKDQAKELYQKVNQQTESLRGLWVAKLNLRGRSAIASPEDLQLYEYKRKELDDEVERRKDLGFTFQQLLRKELDILNEDEKGREEHQISFTATVSETMRVLNGLSENTTSLTHLDRQRVNAKVDALLQDMTVEVTSECQRRGAWALLGQTTGAQLCRAEGEALHYNDIFDADGNLLSDDLVELDPHTGLFVPRDGACNMMLADKFTVVPIPPDFFVHPKTAKVMPMEGNVVYDSVTTRLLVTADNANDDAGNLNETPIPYIPYPVNPETGKHVTNNFTQPAKPSDIKYGDPTKDPKTGLYAPILAVTIHPETGVVYPVGGCQESPVSGLPVPIELGSMMFDPKTDQPVPVVSVSIDPRTGFVIPVGGNMTGSGKGEEVPVIMGEVYVEPLSGHALKVTGARLIDDGDEKELESMGGGYPNALDMSELYHESRVIDALRDWKEAAAGSEALSGRQERSILETRLKELSRSKVKVKTHLLRRLHGVLKREEQTSVLMESGGCPGTYEYYATGQLLPILVGTTMRDMSGSGLDVPILGIDKDPESKEIMPLGGSLEDPHGNGLVPIMLGEKAVDPATDEMSTICGVKLNKDLKITEPVTLSSSLKKRRKAHPTLLSMLEEEYVARRSFWRRQRHRERELSEQQSSLIKQILDNYDVTLDQVSEQVELINEGVSSLSDADHREAQRRGDANIEQTASLPPFIVHWITRLDHPEKEREESHHAAHIRFVDVIERFFAKLQAEESKYTARMNELEGALNPDAEASVTERYYQLKDRLRSELEDHLQTRIEQLDQEHAALEYIREKAELLLSEAKLILGGEGAYTGDFNLLLNGVYGDDIQQSEANAEIIPLLKRVIALLQESGISLTATRLPPGYHTGVAAVSEERPARRTFLLEKDERSLPASVIVHEESSGKPSANISVPSQRRFESQTVALSAPSQDPTKPSISADKIFANLQVNQLGETFSGGDVSVSEIAAAGEWNEEKRKEIGKNLREKHTLECVEHENELRAEEIKAIKEVLEEYQEKKNAKVEELRKELRQNLRQATSSEERETLLEEYSKKMDEGVQALENEKQEKLKDVRQRLKRERLRKKKELYNRHKEEARRAGIEHVVDLDLPSDDQLEQDLIQLAREQEKLLAELQRAYADEDVELRNDLDSERKSKLDAEMEALARAMSTLVPPGDVQAAIDEMKEVSGKITIRQQDFKDKMRTKRERRRAKSAKGVSLTTVEQEALRNVNPGSEEATSIAETAKLRETSNEKKADTAIYNVLAEIEEEELDNTKTRLVNDLLSKTVMTEEEKRSFVTKFFEQATAANEKLNSTREYNQAVLAAKIAARKRMKESLAKEKAMKDELAALSKKQALMSKDSETIDVLETTHELMKESVNEKMTSLEEEQTVRLEQMEVEHKKDVIYIEEELKNAKNSGMSSIEQQMEQQKEKMISAEKAKFEKDLNKKRGRLSEEQVQQLMSEHAENMDMLNRNINMEKDRQLNSLASKIAERRKMKAAILARKHEANVAKELVKQREERNHVEDEYIADTRKKVLTEKVNGMESGRAENTIFRVLQQHHIQQKINLEEQFRSEIKAAHDEARAKVGEERQEGKDELVAAHEKAFIELLSNPEGLTANQLAQKKAELKIRHKREIDQFDKETEAQLNESDKHVQPSLEVKHAHERLRLRERQLQELAGTMSDLMTKEELNKSYEEEAEKAAQNAKEFRERTTFAMSEKIQKMKEARRKQSVTQQEKADDEIRRMETQLEEEREREALRLAEREAERECRKRKQSEEREGKKKLEEAQRGQAEPEKERLLKEHEENMAKFQTHLQNEQERMKAALKEKLEARRRKRKESGVENAANAAQKGEERSRDSRVDGEGIKRHESTVLQTSSNSQARVGAPTTVNTTSSIGSPVVTVGLPENMSENDWLSLLVSSPVFERINEIEELLNQGICVGGNGVLGASRGRPYIDLKDAQWLCSGDLIPVDINELSPANFVVYRFGVFVTQLLQNRMNIPSVTLLLASNLPPNNYDNNAFRNSFFYENSRQILFLREERLHSVGDFVLVIMHCLSHILVDDLSNDQNPLFLRAFYKAMRICCQDMFFARARSTDAAHTLVHGATRNGKSPLEKAFQHVTTTTQRTNVVSELVNIKVTSINDVDYSPKAINRRVIDQNSYMDKAKLRGYLASLHTPTKTTKEFAATRLQQLRGTKKDAPPSNSQRANQRARTHFKTPKDLIHAQLNELQRHLDTRNAELVQVVDRESQLLMSVSEDKLLSEEQRSLVKSQLDGFAMKKELLEKRIAFIEEEITKKKKEAGLL